MTALQALTRATCLPLWPSHFQIQCHMWLSSSSRPSQHVTAAHDIIWPPSPRPFPHLTSTMKSTFISMQPLSLSSVENAPHCYSLFRFTARTGLVSSHPSRQNEIKVGKLHAVFVSCSRWEWMKGSCAELWMLSTLASRDRHRYLADRGAVLSTLSSPNHCYRLCVCASLCVYVPNEG